MENDLEVPISSNQGASAALHFHSVHGPGAPLLDVENLNAPNNPLLSHVFRGETEVRWRGIKQSHQRTCSLPTAQTLQSLLLTTLLQLPLMEAQFPSNSSGT